MHNGLDNDNHSSENSGGVETNGFASTSMSGGYGTTSSQDDNSRFYVPRCGLVLYVVAFLGFFSAMLVRECLSVAIVAMVNQTTVATDEYTAAAANVSEDQCPRDPPLQHEDGQFDWDRHQQGIVLSAFYYGYGFTQVQPSLSSRISEAQLYYSSKLLFALSHVKLYRSSSFFIFMRFYVCLFFCTVKCVILFTSNCV